MLLTKRRSKPQKPKKKKSVGDEAKWLTHYCSDHEILLVGEGDFSFSLCLAKAFGSASNIVASSLDTYGDVIKKYKNAKSNLDELQKLGACLLHELDVTKMKFHSDLNRKKFDRVIYNFPHAGFHMRKREDNLKMIKMHKRLVLGFFENASCLLRANGEIHVSHKTNSPFSNWNIEQLAMQSSLVLIECSDFNKVDYPGYNNKRGDGSRCDQPFPLGKCSTFKFIYNHRKQRKEIQKLEQLPVPIVHHSYYPQASLFHSELVRPVFDLRMGYTPISRDYFNKVAEMHGRVSCSESDHDLRNRNIPFSRDCFNNVMDTHVRVASSVHDLRSENIPISRDHFNNVTERHVRVSCSDQDLRNRNIPISRDYSNNVTETHGKVSGSDHDLRSEIIPTSSHYFNNVTDTHVKVSCSDHDIRNRNIPVSRDYFNNVTNTHVKLSGSDHDLRNRNIPISRDYSNNVTEKHGKVFCSDHDLRSENIPISRDYFNNVTNTHVKLSCSDHDLRNRNIPISRDYSNNVTETHGKVSCSDHDLRSENIPILRDYLNNVTDIHGGRVASSASDSYYRARDKTLDSQGLLQPIESMRSWKPWPTSTSCRTMDIAPYISRGTRNEVFGGSSRYLTEAVSRTDRARLDFERCNGNEPKRTLKSEIYVVQRV